MSGGAVIVVDARGLRCPWPVLRLAKAARDAGPGTIVEITADDPAAVAQIGSYVTERGWSLDASPPVFRVLVAQG